MSNDPFDQLFGDSAPEPVPARERLQREQVERFNTAQLPETKAKQKKPDHPAKPWIIIGIVVVLALVASAIIVSIVRGSDDAPAPSPTPSPTAAPSPTETTSPTPSPTESPEPPEDDDVPSVDVGRTFTMQVPTWNIEVDVSQRLSDISYVIEGDSMVVSSSLIDSLPASCSAMRTQWGMTRVSANSFEVLKPDERCDEAPELYDELWGQLDAMAKSARPL